PSSSRKLRPSRILATFPAPTTSKWHAGAGAGVAICARAPSVDPAINPAAMTGAQPPMRLTERPEWGGTAARAEILAQRVKVRTRGAGQLMFHQSGSVSV